MGRPPCCDKVGIKKGPWTPEEDIVLVSYIQQHGPGNWRAVPTNTGLLRCSKSCRLRWTNYLRPGIKRGNFTPHEEGMIIHLQALLGNKWAAIASYLPQRTDNDIKNYWNTHLKKKIKKLQSESESQMGSNSKAYHQFMSKSYGEKSTTDNSNSGLVLSENSSVYASSAENISRLLEGWMRSSSPIKLDNNNNNNMSSVNANRDFGKISTECTNANSGSFECYSYRADQIQNEFPISNELECILSFDHSLNEQKLRMDNNNPPLSFLEKWMLDESASQVEGIMELSSIY